MSEASRLHGATRTPHRRPVAGAGSTPRSVASAVALLMATGILVLVLQSLNLLVATAVLAGSPSSYGAGAVGGAATAGVLAVVIPLLLSRGLRRHERRARNLTTAIAVLGALLGLAALLDASAIPVRAFGGLVLALLVAVLVLLYRPDSRHWFARS